MPATSVTIDIHAVSEDIFDLVHDYARRLDWDPLLSEASLLHGSRFADIGVVSRCVSRRSLGGLAMETEYVSFSRPEVAAVAMTRGPRFFDLFAASIRHKQIDSDTVQVTYRYNFRARPRCLAFLIEPVVSRILRHETTRRLSALKSYLEARGIHAHDRVHGD